MKFALKAVIVGLIQLGLTTTGLAESPSPAQPLTFGDTVGINTKFAQGEPVSDLEMLKDLRVRWVRDAEKWRIIEQEPGKYVIPEALQKRLEFYKANHIGVMFGLWYDNKTAYPEDEFNPEAYGRYAAAMANKFDAMGLDYVLELWNEPHNFALGPVLGGHWDGSPPSPWVNQYLKLVNAAVKAVKAAVPNARLITDEDVIPCHYWFIKSGKLPKQLDGAAIHPYAHKPTVGPEQMHISQDAKENKPFKMIDSDRSLKSMVSDLSAAYEKALGHKPEIWATEWSYGLGKNLHTSGPITEETSAALLPRVFINAAAVGIRATFWFSTQDRNDGPYGLTDNQGNKRQAYYAFKVMTQTLGDATLVRQLAGKSTPISGLQAYLFNAPMGHRIAVWNIEGPIQVRLQTGSSAPLRVISHLGKPVTIKYAANGDATFEVGIAPVYLTSGVDEDATLTPEKG